MLAVVGQVVAAAGLPAAVAAVFCRPVAAKSPGFHCCCFAADRFAASPVAAHSVDSGCFCFPGARPAGRWSDRQAWRR